MMYKVMLEIEDVYQPCDVPVDYECVIETDSLSVVKSVMRHLIKEYIGCENVLPMTYERIPEGEEQYWLNRPDCLADYKVNPYYGYGYPI